MSTTSELAAAGGLVGALLEAFVRYGYWVVFFGMLAESIVVVGMFTPGEVLLVLAAAYAGQGEGRFDPVVVAGLGALGGVLGSVISYEVGRRGGLAAIQRYGHRVGISEERIAASRAYFEAHGAKTVFIGRWASGVKAWVPALAGASHMRWPVFLLYSVAAALTWSAAVTTLGYAFGANLDALMRVVKGLGWGAFVLLAALVALAVMRARRRRTRRRELAHALRMDASGSADDTSEGADE